MHQQPPPVHLPAHCSSCVVHQHLSKHSYPLSYPSDASNGYHKDTSAVPLRLIRPSHPNSAASRGPSLSRGRAGPRRGPRARLTFTFNTSPSLVKPSPSRGLWTEPSRAQIRSCHRHLRLPTPLLPAPGRKGKPIRVEMKGGEMRDGMRQVEVGTGVRRDWEMEGDECWVSH